jgi:hypothetical protein
MAIARPVRNRLRANGMVSHSLAAIRAAFQLDIPSTARNLHFEPGLCGMRMVSTIKRLKIRILKIGHPRFTGQNAGPSPGKRRNQPQRLSSDAPTYGKVTSS